MQAFSSHATSGFPVEDTVAINLRFGNGMVRDDPLKHQIEHFGKLIRGEAEALVSARDGLLNLRITEALSKRRKLGALLSCPISELH